MAYLIQDLKDDLAGALHGGSLNKVKNLNNLFFRAARQLLLDVDPLETERAELIENALYDKVDRYQVPADLKRNKIIDIRPIANRSPEDNFNQSFSEPFDIYKKNGEFVIESDDAVKTIRISTRTPRAGVLLHDCESPTADGTWAASGGASNLQADETLFFTGAASLRFDLSGVADGILQISDMGEVDLSDHDEKSGIFVQMYQPAAITSASLRWGNSAAAFWSKTVTQGHASAFKVGLNTLRFDWPTATETGSVDPSAIDYMYLDIAYSGTAMPGFRIDSIYSKLPSPFEIVYYSKYLFRTAAGVWIESPTRDSDIINLDTDTYSLYSDCVLWFAAEQTAGEDSLFDAKALGQRYKDNVAKYKADTPSEAQRPRAIYYRKR